MALSPLFLLIIVFIAVFIFIAGASKYFGNGGNLDTLGSILGSIFSTTPPTQTIANSSSSTTTTTINQTKCVLSVGQCMPISTLSPLKCKLEFFDEAFCGKGFKCCIPR